MDGALRQLLAEIYGAWRFRWHAMACAWLVALAGITASIALPEKFEATAQVFVDTRDPLIAAENRGGDADVSVAFVRRLLLSTPNLEQVARETDLARRAPTPDQFQLLIVQLQQQIQVSQAGRDRFEANLYNITYRDQDRAVAERVVQVLLDSFQTQSLEGDLQDDLKALQFLDSQIDDYRRRLEEAEARVADFRRRNAGVVGTEGGFFNRLDQLQDELRQVSTNLRIALATRASLAAQFAATGSGSGGESAAASLTELANQVLATERQLDELRLLYTDEHPSVISAEETLATLETRLERRRQQLGPLIGTGASGAVVENVSIALTQAEVDVNQLAGRERDLRQRIAELQGKVEVAPQLEAELAGLNRDNDVMRNQYESLLQRRELLNFEIDRKREGRQLEFRVIEPPSASAHAVEPNRRVLMLLALVGSLGAGGALAFLLHQMRPVFITSDMVYRQLGIPVLGVVSMAWTSRAIWQRRRVERVFAIGIMALLGVFGVVFMFLENLVAGVQAMLA